MHLYEGNCLEQLIEPTAPPFVSSQVLRSSLKFAPSRHDLDAPCQRRSCESRWVLTLNDRSPSCLETQARQTRVPHGAQLQAL
eukprot:803607-Pleurochrysis_carterae.AAC.3